MLIVTIPPHGAVAQWRPIELRVPRVLVIHKLGLSGAGGPDQEGDLEGFLPLRGFGCNDIAVQVAILGHGIDMVLPEVSLALSGLDIRPE